jgi:hypothetical protein
MSRITRVVVVAAAVDLLVPGTAGFAPTVWAQTIEITPLGGYETSGSYPLEDPTVVQALRADAGTTYGSFVDYRIVKNIQGAFTWIHNATTYSAATNNLDQFAPAFQTSINQFQFGGLYHLRDREFALRPYIAGSLGFTHDSNEGAHPDRSAFSLSLGGSLTYEPTRHIGLRTDALLQRINLTAGAILRL